MTGKKDEQEKYLICGEADSSFFSQWKIEAGRSKRQKQKINAGQLFSLAAKIIKRQKEIISAVYFGPISFPICGFVL